MRVCDDHKSALALCNLFIQLIKFFLRKLDRIECKVFVIVGVKDVHPVIVNGEVILLKVVVSSEHDVRSSFCIFAKVKAQSFDRRPWSFSCYSCKIAQLLLWITWWKQKQFQHTRLTYKVAYGFVVINNEIRPGVGWIHPEQRSVVGCRMTSYIRYTAVLTSRIILLMCIIVNVKESVGILVPGVL